MKTNQPDQYQFLQFHFSFVKLEMLVMGFIFREFSCLESLLWNRRLLLPVLHLR